MAAVKKDKATRDYLERNDVFACIANYYLYGGKQVIRPEELKPIERVQEISSKNGLLKRERDVYKCICKEDGKLAYMLIGIESQSHIDYGMVVRCYVYDGFSIVAQVNVRASDILETPTPGSFLSPLKKGTKLIPVVTIVLYFGEDEWDAPRTLHELFGDMPEEVKQFVPNYRLNIFCPRTMPEEELEKFHSHMKAVFGYLCHAKNKEKLKNFVIHEPSFKDIPVVAVEMINAVTHSRIPIPTQPTENMNMCLALQGIIKDAQDEGKKRGLEEGEKRGEKRGEKNGIEKTTIHSLIKIMSHFSKTLEQALKTLEIPETQW